ncbi:MAG: helix-turn-helix transcriptional regulator [Pigmentiphaga sp.]
MSSASRSTFLPSRSDQGLFRTAVAGGPAKLSAVLHSLRDTLALPVLDGCYGARVGTGDGHDTWELFSLNDDILMVLADCHYRAERTEWVLSESFIELHFTLVGSAIASWPQTHQAPSGDLDLVLCHLGDQARYRITCSPGRRRSLALYVRPRTFARFIDSTSEQGRQILADLDGVGPRDIYFNRVPIGATHVDIVSQLLANPYTDRRRLIYVAAKVDELLCAAVELWAHQDRSTQAAITLGPRDLRRLHLARSRLLNDLAVTYTIPGLATEVGINTAKLKAGFRLVFGCTVHECVLRARMAQALELLSRQTPVNDVALAVGYQHASSFSNAFTRHFGYNPRQTRLQVPGYNQSNEAVSAT